MIVSIIKFLELKERRLTATLCTRLRRAEAGCRGEAR
ncbi:hypothetical protein LINGRAHAP2_LOCUS19962 [Linum grandiflorum]